VHLDEQIDPGADGLAHGGHRRHRLLLVLAGEMRPPGAGKGIELEGAEAAGHRLARERGIVGRRLALAVPAVGVDADALAARPAQQRVHGHAVALPRDIPQRLLEAADRAPEIHGPALGREVVVGHVEEMRDVRGVAPHQVTAQRVHESDDARVAVGLRVTLAPAVRAGLRLDLDEEEVLAPAQVDEERGDATDAQGDLRELAHEGDSTRIR